MLGNHIKLEGLVVSQDDMLALVEAHISGKLTWKRPREASAPIWDMSQLSTWKVSQYARGRYRLIVKSDNREKGEPAVTVYRDDDDTSKQLSPIEILATWK